MSTSTCISCGAEDVETLLRGRACCHLVTCPLTHSFTEQSIYSFKPTLYTHTEQYDEYKEFKSALFLKPSLRGKLWRFWFMVVIFDLFHYSISIYVYLSQRHLLLYVIAKTSIAECELRMAKDWLAHSD